VPCAGSVAVAPEGIVVLAPFSAGCHGKPEPISNRLVAGNDITALPDQLHLSYDQAARPP